MFPVGLPEAIVAREDDLALLREYTTSDSLMKHMLAVEAAMRAYARKLDQDEQTWGCVGLLHDFDYERWPDPQTNRSEGQRFSKSAGYSDEVIYAIKSHANYLEDCPRVSLLDKALFAVR